MKLRIFVVALTSLLATALASVSPATAGEEYEVSYSPYSWVNQRCDRIDYIDRYLSVEAVFDNSQSTDEVGFQAVLLFKKKKGSKAVTYTAPLRNVGAGESLSEQLIDIPATFVLLDGVKYRRMAVRVYALDSLVARTTWQSIREMRSNTLCSDRTEGSVS